MFHGFVTNIPDHRSRKNSKLRTSNPSTNELHALHIEGIFIYVAPKINPFSNRHKLSKLFLHGYIY